MPLTQTEIERIIAALISEASANHDLITALDHRVSEIEGVIDVHGDDLPPAEKSAVGFNGFRQFQRGGRA